MRGGRRCASPSSWIRPLSMKPFELRELVRIAPESALQDPPRLCRLAARLRSLDMLEGLFDCGLKFLPRPALKSRIPVHAFELVSDHDLDERMIEMALAARGDVSGNPCRRIESFVGVGVVKRDPSPVVFGLCAEIHRAREKQQAFDLDKGRIARRTPTNRETHKRPPSPLRCFCEMPGHCHRLRRKPHLEILAILHYIIQKVANNPLDKRPGF